MKIAFLSFYSGEIDRGVEVFVHNLANELVGFGHEVLVYQNAKPKLKTSYEVHAYKYSIDWTQNGNEGRRILYPFTNYWIQLVGKFTKQVLKDIPKDVDVVIPTNGSLQSLYCKWWCIKNKKKMVISGQSGPGFDDRWNLWCFPDTFVAKTDFHKAWAKKANPFARITKIHNGVELKVFQNLTELVDLGLRRPIFLSVGALVPIKRHELAIKAVSKLKQGSLLIIGGDKTEETYAKMIKRLGSELLKDRFRVEEFDHSKMPQVYKYADAFTFATSPWESFGIVLLEALASGLPIVCTDDPIRREIVGDCGIYVDPTDTEAYAAALEEALNKKWDKKKLRARAEMFSWDKIAREYEKLFLGLIQ